MNFVTIYFRDGAREIALTLPALTTGKYAAKRVAEQLGIDPDANLGLAVDGNLIDPDEILAAYDNIAFDALVEFA